MTKVVSTDRYTPGPWHVVPGTPRMPAYICTDPKQHLETEIAVVYSRRDEPYNARLIAASPALLAALKRVYPYIAEKALREEIGALLNEIEQ